MGGSVSSLPRQPRRFLQKAQWFHFYDLDGQQRSLDLDPARWRLLLPGAVVAHQSGPQRIEITRPTAPIFG